ncbi:MAG: hypothetical protein ACRD5M_06035 [Candidatus Acidiferrales bacterium]
MIKDRQLILTVAPLFFAMFPMMVWAQEALEKATFHIKYIAQGVVYIDAGRSAGLKEGQKLLVEHIAAPAVRSPGVPLLQPPSGIVATLQVISVAASSAVCEIVSSTEPVAVGDLVRFSPEVVQERKEEVLLTGGRSYPQVITFTSGDPAVEEARAAVPRPPSPEINRMRGRIGLEYDTVVTRNIPSSTSSAVGLVARMDMTRIAGTFWNFSGYWRGRFTSLSGNAQPVTVSDLINRTYHLALTYDNPESRWVAGGGRLYLPWATSLDTMDGGYVGRKFGEHGTVGVFAGSTPDPTSYDYNPNQKLAGAFMNFQGGDWSGTRYSTTFGIALSAINWHANRQFLFSETGIFFKHNLAIYDSMEIDAAHTVVTDPGTTTTPPTTSSTGGLNRSYVTLRYVPHPRLELSLSDTYFRDFPTFDPQLIGTGLLDRYLFQGLSGGVRVNLPERISIYTEQGQSSRSGDSKSSWNQMYGITVGELWRTGFRADLRYSKFNSSFGSGDYKAISLSRPLRETLQFNVQAGFQNFNSTLTNTTQTHFINSYVDWAPGKFIFFQAGYTWQRGGTMNYDQFQFIVGKRF